MEQRFANRLRHVRCTWEQDVERTGPSHVSVARVTIRIFSPSGTIVGEGAAPKTKDAVRAAMTALWPRVDAIPDPCTSTLPWTGLWPYVQKPRHSRAADCLNSRSACRSSSSLIGNGIGL